MRKKIRNWPEYNKSLQERGGILFNFASDYLAKLYHEGPHARGGLKTYTSAMYEYLLTVKIVLRLPWRAAVEFAENLLKNAYPGEGIFVPNYAHASREAQKLALKLKSFTPSGPEGMVLAFGINVYDQRLASKEIRGK